MKGVTNILAFIFSLIILLSCEPRRDDNGDYLFGVNQNTESGGGSTTQRLLKKIISHEKNDETGLFEDGELTYNYVGTKLISTKDDTGEVTTFTYNADNKMDKIEGSAQITTYKYADNNVSQTLTDIPGFSKVTADFTYVGGKLTKTISVQEYTLPIPIKFYFETTYEYSGANMSTGLIKSGIDLPDGTLEMNSETTQIAFTYDQKKSPYSLLPKEFAYYVAGIAPQGAAFFSTNNLTKYVTTLGGISETINYIYEYDALDYALKIVEGEDYTKYEYQ